MWLVTTVALVCGFTAAAVLDIRTRRIPNSLSLGIAILGLALRAAQGIAPLTDGLAGAGLGFVAGLLLFAAGGLGGGDAKLLIATGAFLGFQRGTGGLLLIGVLGGFFALGEAIRRGVILPSLYNAAGLLGRVVTLGRRGKAPPRMGTSAAVTVPYGVPIALGTIAWWFWGVSVL